MRLNKTQRGGALYLFVILVVLAGSVAVVRAATYNFYFNNIEQGDHATASPAITVQGKEVTGAESVKKSTDSSQTEPAMTQAAVPPSSREEPRSVAQAAAATRENHMENDHWRLDVSYSTFRQFHPYYILDDGRARNIDGRGLTLGLGYFLNKYIGLHAYAMISKIYGASSTSKNYGGELELLPIHIPYTKQGYGLSAGLLGGYSNTGIDSGAVASFKKATGRSSYPDTGRVAWKPHVGARVSMALADGLSAILTGRQHVDREKFRQLDLGLAFYF